MTNTQSRERSDSIHFLRRHLGADFEGVTKVTDQNGRCRYFVRFGSTDITFSSIAGLTSFKTFRCAVAETLRRWIVLDAATPAGQRDQWDEIVGNLLKVAEEPLQHKEAPRG